MKKIFTFFCLLMLGAGMSVQANAPYLYTGNNSYLPYCEVKSLGSNNFMVRLYSYSTGSSKYRAAFHYASMNMGSANDIRGSHDFSRTGTTCTYNTDYICYDSDYKYADNQAGTITFQYTGKTSGGYPVYAITLNCTAYKESNCKSDNFILSSYEMPVRVTNNAVTLRNQTTITGASNNPSWGSVTGGGNYNTIGQSVTLRAVPEAGYAFDSWTDDPSLGAERTITVGNSDATYTANFRVASKGTITGLSNNNSYGTVTVSPSGEQNGGTAVTLTPVANEGYSFSQWSDGNTDNPRTVYVDGDHTYTAQFVEGISINVQSFLFRDNAASSGWFNFQGITTGYQFVFFVNNSSVVGNYTQAHLDADNKIYDHGTELSITTASFSVTADANNYYLDGQFICSNGKRYIIHTWHEKPYGPFADDEASSGNYDGTSFSSITSNNLQSDGSYLVKANAGNPSGMSYAYQTEIDFIVDSEKQHGSEKIPSGFYFINHSGAAGTVKATNAIGYLDLNYYNDYDDIGGSYVRETYHQSGGNIGSLWIWTLNDGYARVTNVNEQYYIYVRARNSKKYTAYYTIGTAPF